MAIVSVVQSLILKQYYNLNVQKVSMKLEPCIILKLVISINDSES